MTYTLYNRLGSGGFAVEAALTLAGIPHELVLLDSVPSTPLPEEFAKINPWKQVPALLTEDGTLITETAAILIWLAGRHRALGPEPWSDAHGEFLRWIVFMGSNIYEGVLRQTYPARFTTDTGTDAVRAAAAERNHAAFALIEATLEHRETLTPGGLGAADIFLSMLTVWHRRRDDLPRCMALARQVAEHPDLAAVWHRNFAHRLDKIWS